VLNKHTVLTPRLEVIWKVAIGIQSYTIDTGAEFSNGNYTNSYSQTLKGSVFATFVSAGFDYHISKVISIGVETSILPAKYKKLKDNNDNEYLIDENVRVPV